MGKEAIKTTPEYFDLLNKAVAREMQVSTQYLLQHTRIEKLKRKVIPENILLGEETTYEKIASIFKKLAIEEMKHMAHIMERIYILGGEKATTKPAHIEIGNTLSDFSKLGAAAEEEALELYREIISMARKLGDHTTKQMFQQIYKEEEDHLLIFQEYEDMVDEPESDAPEAEWQKIFDDEYITLLNKALASEISAIVQYTNQHEKASKEEFRKKIKPLEVAKETNKASVISKLLKPVFMQEMDHFEKIAERIYEIGKDAIATVEPLPNVDGGPEEWIKNNREAENYAIILYRKIIEEANKRGDIKTRTLFEKIIQEEEEHFWTFDEFM